MSFSHYKTNGNFEAPRSISGLQPTSNYYGGSLQFEEDEDLYTLTSSQQYGETIYGVINGRTRTGHENTMCGGINDSTRTQHGTIQGGINDRTRTQHGNTIYDLINDGTRTQHTNSIYDGINGRTRTQHGNTIYDRTSTKYGARNNPIYSKNHDLSTSTATSSANRLMSTTTSSANRLLPTTTSSAHKFTSTISNRNKQHPDLYALTLALYQHDDDDIDGTDDLIKNYVKRTPATSTTGNNIPSNSTIVNHVPSNSTTDNHVPSNSTTDNHAPSNSTNGNHVPSTPTTGNYIPSTPTIGSYIPSPSTTGNYIPTNSKKNRPLYRSTTTSTPLSEQDVNFVDIESYINRMERKHDPIRQSEQSTIGQNQRPTVPHSDNSFSLISDDGGEHGNGDESLQDASLSNRDTHSLGNDSSMAASIHGSDDESTERHKRRKMDVDSDVVVEPKLRPLALNEIYEQEESPTIIQRKTRDSRPSSSRKDNDKTGLAKLLHAITLDAGHSSIDEKQELAFFDDETPKHTTSRQGARQSLVNGFDGFSEDDGDDG